MFDYLVDLCRVEGVRTLNILGDLTDAKDYHPASLTNRVVEQMVRLKGVVPDIRILMGNHDYLRGGHAYFNFLSLIPGIRFISTPWEDLVTDDGPSAVYLPHTRTPSKDWEPLNLGEYNYAFMHQTVGGAVASNGQVMEDEGVPVIRGPKVFSGDIHVPQTIKGVEYVGSPYHVHFGDNFTPRLVLIDRRSRFVDLHYETIRRVSLKVSSLRELKRHDLVKGDQVKLTMLLEAADKHDWARIKREAVAWLEEVGVEVHGVNLSVTGNNAKIADVGGSMDAVRLSDDKVVERFVLNDGLGPDALDAGLEIVG